MTEHGRIGALAALLVAIVSVLTFAVVGPRHEQTCHLVRLGSTETTPDQAARAFPDAFQNCTRIVTDH
jgi:hypothetical protein